MSAPQAAHLCPPSSFAAALVCMAVAAALRFPGLTAQSLWIDEIYSAEMTRWPLDTILRVQDGHPPLFALLHLALARVVDVDVAGRLISAVAGVLTVGLMVRFADALWGSRTAVVAGVLMAVSPLHVWYSQEGRSYALVMLCGVASSLAMARALREPRRRTWIPFAIWSVCGLFTHYLYAALLVAQGVFLVLSHAQLRLLAALAAVLAVGAIALPVLGPEATSFAGDQRGFEWSALAYTGFTFLAGFGLGPSIEELHRHRGLEMVVAYWPAVALVAGVALALLLAAPRAFSHAGTWGRYVLLWMILPVALAFIGSWARDGAYNVRYAIVALPALVLALALVLTDGGPTRLAAGLALVVAMSATSIAYDRLDPGRFREDVRAAARFLEANAAPNDRIVVSAHYMDFGVRHYFHGPNALEPLVVRPMRTAADADRNLADLRAPSSRRTWLVLVRDWEDDPNGDLRARLAPLADVATAARFPGVRIFRFPAP